MNNHNRLTTIILFLMVGSCFNSTLAEEVAVEAETSVSDEGSVADAAGNEVAGGAAVLADAPAKTAGEKAAAMEDEASSTEVTIPAMGEAEQNEADVLVQQAVDRAKEALAAAEQQPSAPDSAVRINHVPEFIKTEIRDQVRADLRADVVQDVLTQAKNEQWGMPQALPSWVNKIKFKGDIRLREQGDFFADGNTQGTYHDISVINAAGGYVYAGPEKFTNITEDRLRMRTRARVQMDAKVTEGVKASVRLSTGNQKDPVSTNQTVGTYANRYQPVWDQVYVKYQGYDEDRYPYLTLFGGRIPNPWLSTDLVWDGDLAFEGVAATYRRNLRGTENLLDMSENDRTLFATVGIFPLQEVELSNSDKWLYGAQVGTEIQFENQSSVKVGLAYYYYDNITGVRNKATDSTDFDYTAPQYMQKGNVLFNIRNSTDPDAQLWALAADYRELNLTAIYDIARYAPLHVVLTGDIVKNIGYNQNEIEKRAQGIVERSQGWSGEQSTNPRTLGYQLGVTVGWPRVTLRGNWNVSLFYKYLQRDAVLDAFTDSDFHLGGTDAKGWVMTGNYGLEENTWLSLRWITSESIDGAPMGVDTLQVYVNAKF